MQALPWIQSSLSNIAIIFLMHLCIITLYQYREYFSIIPENVGIVFLVSSAVILMFYLPIQLGEFFVDLRLIPLAFIALRWGFKHTLAALAITTLWRLAMGGVGSIPGVLFGMIIPVLFILAYSAYRKSFTPLTIVFLFTVSWFLSDIPIIFLMPDGWVVFKEIGLIRYTSFVLTAFILYLFILHAERDIQVRQKLQFYAEHDHLTGLYNIRYFHEAIRQYAKTPLSKYIVMIDIDHFKAINDTYGHTSGDLILKQAAQVIVDSISRHIQHTVVGRYGGEEFILFLAINEKEKIIDYVESIRHRIGATAFLTETGAKVSITVSIGVAEIVDWSLLNQAINEADHCLYTSKHNGRNQAHYA